MCRSKEEQSLKDCNIEADVIIDFSSADALPALLEGTVGKKVALIIATTGHTPEDKQLIEEKASLIPIFQAANMSVGRIKERLPDLGISVMKDIVKVTAQGVGMEIQSGVAARLFEVLAGLEIKIISVTTSETQISYIINQQDAPRAVKAIKEVFGI